MDEGTAEATGWRGEAEGKASEVGTCATHPGASALGACQRCGRFCCEACLADPKSQLCAECVVRVGDPLGWRRLPFAVGPVIRAGLRLTVQELPIVLAVTLAFTAAGAALDLLVGGKGVRAQTNHLMVSSLYEMFIGLVGQLALLARFIARVEGRDLSPRAAFAEALANWVRCFGARFRVGLNVFGFALLLGVPGVWKAVRLAFASVAALRSRRDALDGSEALVRGRWWPVLGLVCLSWLMTYGPLLGVALLGRLSVRLGVPQSLGLLPVEWLSRVAHVGDLAVMLAAYYAIHGATGRALEPMSWTTRPPWSGTLGRSPNATS